MHLMFKLSRLLSAPRVRLGNRQSTLFKVLCMTGLRLLPTLFSCLCMQPYLLRSTAVKVLSDLL